MPDSFPVLTAAAYSLFHAPFFTAAYGSAPHAETKRTEGGAEFAQLFAGRLRSFEDVAGYLPNQAYIGNIDPRELPPRPWYEKAGPGGEFEMEGRACRGRFGSILSEELLYSLVKVADVFDLVALEQDFSELIFSILEKDPVLSGLITPKHRKGIEKSSLEKEIAEGALPLESKGEVVGCVRSAHPDDVNLHAHTILENLAAKATAVYTVRDLLNRNSVDPESIDYIIETSEEACGDINQRGGGNFAKAVGELSGLSRATGSDTRSFCAGPVHGILQAAGLVRSGIFESVVVTAGGTTAKLGMNSKKHIEKGLPVLEDCMAGFAVLVRREGRGLVIRTDVVGRHRIGSGASPQAVIQDLVTDPLASGGFGLSDVDLYAPELQNPEITENAGAGNVTEANLKMIAAMAVMKKEIERSSIPDFINEHGVSGWAPTQGHIPSGVPALGWLLRYAEMGTVTRAMVIGKGSLFLGRMTNLFDGVSILFESSDAGPSAISAAPTAESFRIPLDFSGYTGDGPVALGLTLPGSEAGTDELIRGAESAAEDDPNLEIVFFGSEEGTPEEAHREMSGALAEKKIDGALTFHYPFPVGVATVGMVNTKTEGKPLFIATTTGTVSTSRVEALVLNTVLGVSVARTYGIVRPKVGLINLEGAQTALRRLKETTANGFDLNLTGSARGDELLRGNDVLAGTVDVAVCDSLTGNLIMKLLAASETDGTIETKGSGYGPGIGVCMESLVGIISRATSPEVTGAALLYLARMVRGNLPGVVAETYGRFLAAGGVIGKVREPRVPESAASGPPKKPVGKEIEGIDVLEIDSAAALLSKRGIYAEAGMGCTGPVVMVAGEDAESALRVLEDGGYL